MPRFVRAGLTEEQEKAKNITAIKVLGVQERSEGGSHFVYAIEVTNAVGDACTVFRRYRRFDALLQRLADKATDEQQGDLPSLPTKRILTRSHTRKVAEERIPGITLFLGKLLRSPWMADQGVVDFLKPDLDDGKVFDPEADGAAAKSAPPPPRGAPPVVPGDISRGRSASPPGRPGPPSANIVISPPTTRKPSLATSPPTVGAPSGLLAELAQRRTTSGAVKAGTLRKPPPPRTGASPPKVPAAPATAILPPSTRAGGISKVTGAAVPPPPKNRPTAVLPPQSAGGGSSVADKPTRGPADQDMSSSSASVPANELAGLLKAKQQALKSASDRASQVSSRALSSVKLRSTVSTSPGVKKGSSVSSSGSDTAANPYAGVLSQSGRSMRTDDDSSKLGSASTRPSMSAKPTLGTKPSAALKPKPSFKTKPQVGGGGASGDLAAEVERLKSKRKVAMEKDDDDEVARLTTLIKSTKIKVEAEAKAKAEAEAKAKREAEAKAKAKQEAELKAKKEAEAKARREAEAKVKKEAEAKAKKEAEAKAQKEAEAKAKKEAEAKAKRDAEIKKQEAEAAAQREADVKAKREVEAKAKKEADAKAKTKSEAKAKQDAEAKKTSDAAAKAAAARLEAEETLAERVAARVKADTDLERHKASRKAAMDDDNDDEVTRLTIVIKAAKATAEAASKAEADATAEVDAAEDLPSLPDSDSIMIVCHVGGERKELALPATVGADLKYDQLVGMVSGFLVKFSIVLNYTDISGDVVAIRDQEDFEIFLEELSSPNHIDLVVTDEGDFSVYKNKNC